MEFYFGFQVREYSLNSIARIDDGILQAWVASLYSLDEVQTGEELISTSCERIIGKMKSWMNGLISFSSFRSQCFYIQFLLPKVCIIFLSECLELPEKRRLICIHHSMSKFFKNFV